MRRRLADIVTGPDFSGHLGSEVVGEILASGERLTRHELMEQLLRVAGQFARPVTSGYRVGAVASGASGALYLGANLELERSPLSFAVHAEQSAVASALAHGERTLDRLLIQAAPCGHCRQFLNELANAASLTIEVPNYPDTTLGELLPTSFGPHDLGVEGCLLSHDIAPLVADFGGDPLVDAALAAARRSYAPYTGSPSAVAFALKDGTVVEGVYIESAAYNPSLSPMMSALDRRRFRAMEPEIEDAVLVEIEGAAVSQAPLARLILESVSRNTTLRVIRVGLGR